MTKLCRIYYHEGGIGADVISVDKGRTINEGAGKAGQLTCNCVYKLKSYKHT